MNYVDPSGHIMLGNTDMPGFVRGEVNGETVFYFPDSFSDYAENRLAEKAEENRRFMDGVEEFLLYNPVGQGISIVSSALLSPVTGTAVLLRDQHLANTYGEARDEMADFFEVNNNLLAGFAGSFHGTYQLLKDPAYLVFGAAYIIEKPNETIFRDPLERPLAMVDAFWEGDNKGSVRYTGQAIGYAVQFAVQAAISRQAIQSCRKPKVQDEKGAISNDKVDFYVTPKGEVIPSTGYRYISEKVSYLDNMRDTMLIPADVNGTYFSFDNYSVANPGALQVPHDASVKVSFDTLQIIDDISIPYGDWGRASYLEPITQDFPQFGVGGATQVITHSEIKIDIIQRLPK